MIFAAFRAFRDPTPTQMLAKLLVEAKRSRIEHSIKAEEHNAWVTMLDARIARIEKELTGFGFSDSKAMVTFEDLENSQ